MGTFRTDIELENPAMPGERVRVEALLVAAGTRTIDELVFAEPGDRALLGARTLEGLNVVVDPVSRRLVDSGAMPAAAAA